MGRLKPRGLIEVHAYQYKIIWDISKKIKQYWKQIQINGTCMQVYFYTPTPQFEPGTTFFCLSDFFGREPPEYTDTPQNW